MTLCSLRLATARSLSCRLCLRRLGGQAGDSSERLTSAQKQQAHRLRLFKEEQRRQSSSAKSGKEIDVEFSGPGGESVVAKAESGVSTPLTVASGVSKEMSRGCALALVDNSPWDMRRPLTSSCSLRLLRFKTPKSQEEVRDIQICNSALWRSGSLLLGSVLETAFKDEYRVSLVSYPPPLTKSGSFVYDCQLTKPRIQHSILELSNRLQWRPTQAELRLLSVRAASLIEANLPYETLDVPAEVARKMFRDNRHKLEIVRRILGSGKSQTLTLHRVGDFVDISGGPAIASTGLIGRFLVTAGHTMETKELGQLLRVQGLAIPVAFVKEFASLGPLVERASALNTWCLPAELATETAVGRRTL